MGFENDFLSNNFLIKLIVFKGFTLYFSDFRTWFSTIVKKSVKVLKDE
jgi:hypothetical protein